MCCRPRQGPSWVLCPGGGVGGQMGSWESCYLVVSGWRAERSSLLRCLPTFVPAVQDTPGESSFLVGRSRRPGMVPG